VGRVERRRRWSDGEKLAVVMAALEPDAVVAQVARRFDVTRQQVYDWRRAARRGDLGLPGGVVGFVEVIADAPAHGAAIEAESTQTAAAPKAAPNAALNTTTTAFGAVPALAMTLEIVLVGGRVLRAPTDLPTAELRRLIEAFRLWCEQQLTLIPGKGDLAKAMRYALTRWSSFTLFLGDGRVAIDNNAAERAIKVPLR